MFENFDAKTLIHYKIKLTSAIKRKIGKGKSNILFIYISGCCIFEKPRKFGESSSSDSDDECDHCQGHVERKKKKKPTGDNLDEGNNVTVNAEPCSTVTVDN